MILSHYYTVQSHPWRTGPRGVEAGPGREARPVPGKFTIDQLLAQRQVLASFVARIEALGPLSGASAHVQARVLREVAALARRIDAGGEKGVDSPYGRRVLYEDPSRWSIAAVVLRPGQSTECHDHGGWGCAVTVQGIERNVCFAHDSNGNLTPAGERDYLPGSGYVFEATEVHQPVGADSDRVTVALHFLVQESHAQAHLEVEGPRQARAA